MRSNHTIPVVNRKEPLVLAIGDLFLLAFSLWATLVLRYGSLPSAELIRAHEFPFAIVFAFSLIVFYIAGLYSRAIHAGRASLPGTILSAQIANGLIAVILFYFIPSFSVTPKINLFVYLFLSSVFIILWRLNTYSIMSLRRRNPALVIGASPETDELVLEMAHNPRIGLYCREKISPEELSTKLIKSMESNPQGFQYVVADLDDARIGAVLPELYRRFFGKATIIDLHELYEDVFDRIPLSRMNYAWIMSQISLNSPKVYDAIKRGIDAVLSVIVGIVACILYPFVALAIKLEDKGPVFISQERVGKNGRLIRIYKFRSMQRNDSAKWVAESAVGDNKVTRVGHFLRRSRIDELPQALAILRGDMSLIGPRADVIGLAERLEKEIPYYAVRTITAPGLTGWAQINQEKPPQSVEETRRRLSYDLYYITHRSLGLDLQITLRTMKTLLSRVGM
ncbi:MAG: sugar transferase [Candidatus Parcubacteria bacterium]|nr:sugar transferase [Candidatus Parcubacteria bacterium]